MSIPLNEKDIQNRQQMEVTVCGPDGATHLILCTGVANLKSGGPATYTFLVGPKLSRRQFVGVITSGGISKFKACNPGSTRNAVGDKLLANLISLQANFDEEKNRVKVKCKVSFDAPVTKLAISYCVNILAELPMASYKSR